MKTARNVAIIALLALGVAVLPGGGNAAEAVLTTLSLIFLVLIALSVRELYRQNRLAYDGLTDRQRVMLIGSLGLLVLAVTGADELTDGGPGTVAWLVAIGAAIFGIVRVVQESREY